MRLLLTPMAMLTALLLPSVAAAQAGWLADRNTGCKIWDDNAAAGGSATWTGPCVGGMGQGRGVLVLFSRTGTPGVRYEGDLRGGKLEGRGVYLWPNGNRYEGELRNGNFHGQGTMNWANGDRYVGQWANDVAHGLETKTVPDGRTYSGQWNNGCFKQGTSWATVGRSAEQCGFK